MSYLDRILARSHKRSWPVGKGEVMFEGPFGHDQSEFAPPEYGDYLATSNDIYSIVALRARMVSQLILKFYNGRGSDKKEQPDSGPASLYRYVNKHWTQARLVRMDELSMGVWGQTFWAVEKDRGEPKEIWWLKPSRVQPMPDSTGYISEFIYNPPGSEPITFYPEEIVWHRYPNPLDEYSPLSPLAAARMAADSAKAMMTANNTAFTNGLGIAGLIVPPGQDKVQFTDDQASDLELMLSRRFSGAKNNRKWGVLRHEAKFLPLQMTQKDAEFLGGLNMTFRMACRAYGVPPALLGDLENATLANLREMQRGLWEQTLIPDATLRAQEIEEQFLPLFRGGPDHCEHDTIAIPALQESASEAWVRDAQALDRGLFTINEVRRRIGMPDVEWGDKPYMPANKGQVDDNGMVQLPQTPDGTKLPDDEANPSNAAPSPRSVDGFDHHQARAFLSSLRVPSLNGVRR